MHCSNISPFKVPLFRVFEVLLKLVPGRFRLDGVYCTIILPPLGCTSIPCFWVYCTIILPPIGCTSIPCFWVYCTIILPPLGCTSIPCFWSVVKAGPREVQIRRCLLYDNFTPFRMYLYSVFLSLPYDNFTPFRMYLYSVFLKCY
jgi:hypothetical protein